MTTKTTAFEIFSKTTGHSFGTWDATTASEAMDQMEAQAGEIDRSDLEALLVVCADTPNRFVRVLSRPS